MNTKGPCALALLLSAFASTGMAYDPGADDITTVTARASADYVRVRQADGTYVPETYVFGKGGNWPIPMKDASMDYLSFLDVAHMIAGPLASQHYVPGAYPAETKLLVMVYWGTSLGQLPGPQTQEAVRLHDRMNIRMLGYESWYNKHAWMDTRGTAYDVEKKDLKVEIEDNRYFVVLMAYDFQLISRERKHRLLWETRFSLRQQHHDFDKDLPSMAAYASRYFGQDSGGLVRKPVPEGQVEIGNLKDIGEEAPAKN